MYLKNICFKIIAQFKLYCLFRVIIYNVNEYPIDLLTSYYKISGNLMNFN